MSVLAYMGYYYYDVTYLLVILGAVLSMIASAQVNSTFKRYSRVRSSCGMTGAEAAERILYRNGLSNVRIEHISGNLTDHYDPSSKVLRLSDATYNATSVAAVGVAAHECGHARGETSPAGRESLWQDERVPLQRAGVSREVREAPRRNHGLVDRHPGRFLWNNSPCLKRPSPTGSR